MTIVSDTEPTSSRSPCPFLPTVFDTTAGSALHVLPDLLKRLGLTAFTPVAIYFLAVTCTYVPLLFGAYLSQAPLFFRSGPVLLPFLRDINVMFMFLVAFPCLMILAVTDQQALTQSLSSVQADGVIAISESNRIALIKRWQRSFRIINPVAQAFGIAVGTVVAYLNFHATMADTGAWSIANGHFLAVGYIFLFCVLLFYAVTVVYIVRNFTIAFLLQDFVTHAHLRMLPLHPDRAGGLQPIGHFGLRNQYLLTLFGLNAALTVLVCLQLNQNSLVKIIIITAPAAYLILGPLVFMAPLLPFRAGMLRNKEQLMRDVAQRIRLELDDLRARLPSGPITAGDEQMIERLRNVGNMIRELPVWPFDPDTLRKFLAAYVSPIVIPLVSSAVVAGATKIAAYLANFIKS